MTPERWRAVDAILQLALASDPAHRDAIVADACEGDLALRAEVSSLLAAERDASEDFLERPAGESLHLTESVPLAERISRALEGRYEIEREIARGGMATVYLARDLRHGRRVAIKVLRDEIAATIGAERFLAEIRVTASLQHPHILPLFDSGSATSPAAEGGPLLWYAMPFVEGETLRSRLVREGRLPVDEAVRLAREIAEALAYAHARGVIHRDVKPENVLLQGGHALIADFGVALALAEAGGERLTQTGLSLGTPQYMAPEQAAGERALDARVDVYALGAVLHEMIAGESPFVAATRQAVVQRLMFEPPAALATRRPDVPSWIADAVWRALAKRPDDRFQSAAAFASALDVPPARADRGASSGSGPRPMSSAGRTVPARAALHAAAVALVIGLAGGAFLDRSSFLQRGAGAVREATTNAVRPVPSSGPLVVVDRSGRSVRDIPANRPWTPRFSPDGRRVAYGAFGEGRSTSDLWVTDLDAGTTRRITDDDADANDPQWSADATSLAYSAHTESGKSVMLRSLAGGASRVVDPRDGTRYPSDWARDGSALLVSEEAGANRHDILVQPADGSPARPYAATAADETAGRISPDGHWVAYTSDESGRQEVYLDTYPRPGRRVKLSADGGVHPVFRGDGRELYFWRGDALMAVPLQPGTKGGPPVPGRPAELFRAKYLVGVNTMYDVSPDGQRFVIVRQP